MHYKQQYQASLQQPEQFWADKSKLVHWFTPPQTILSKDENDNDRWFADGELNTAFLALDHHVLNGRGEQLALIYDSPVTGVKKQYTYSQLTEAVARFAGALAELGVVKGERVIIYMPMIPQAVIAMLACARLGAIHSVVFGGFSAAELAIRIDDIKPKLLLSASCGIELDRVIPYKPIVDEALYLSKNKPQRCVVFQREKLNAELINGQDLDWQELVSKAQPADCVKVKATDPLYVLYTSGTTGKPKGVVRDNGGHAVAMCYSMEMMYGLQAGDVFFTASDVGWVVGHSYIVYGPLIAGCTTVMYEGKPVGTPDAGAFWRVCQDYKVKALFAAPTVFRAIRKQDPECTFAGKYDLSNLEVIFMAGERLDPSTYQWVVEHLHRPVIDHWWQTETGWVIAGNHYGLDPIAVKPGSSTRATPGFDVCILDAHGQPVAKGEEGSIAIKLPLPPGCLTTIWGNHQRYIDSYLSAYPGYFISGDGGYYDEDDYLFILGRTDDIINVAGHRLATGVMEEVVASHNAVAECAVIGRHSEVKGEEPLGLVLLKDGTNISEEQLQQELIAMVRERVGAVASFKQAFVVPKLPKTRSGKILRKTLRQIANHEEYNIPSTIDDPSSLTDIEQVFKQRSL